MGISMLGLLVNDLIFIVTPSFLDYLPGGYWFLIFGFALEGMVGGKLCLPCKVYLMYLKACQLGLLHHMPTSRTALILLSGTATHPFMTHSIK